MNDSIEELVVVLRPHLAEFFEVAGIPASEQALNSRRLIEAAMRLPGSSTQYLMTVEIREGVVIEVVYYDAAAAAGFLAGLVGGVAGASNWIVLGCTVVACLASLKQVKRKVSHAQGALFWALYDSPVHRASREQARRRFEGLCGEDVRVRPEDFAPALQGLVALGCVSQGSGSLCIKDVVIVQ